MSQAALVLGTATTGSVFATCVARGRKAKHKAPPTKGNDARLSVNVGFGTDRKDPLWRCAQGCGACCKLQKGPSFASPEEIFHDPSDIQLYRSMIGPDGWCIHFEKTTRTCSIYSERPYFCRVEPQIFRELYGIDDKKFNKEACSCCRDTIKAIYGAHSEELDNFHRTIKNQDCS
ncbi:uncharacterized protein LOC122652051 [Telopea speciosissima]|uniref:uncharacterized protein LOC122652051 n=1 Tax=Telopea speciosissima TaxID=54955 RepID=UPI001CC6AC63|nr:uncharacterized protein LOC122652051 [Telopea speciosissima]